MKETINYKLRNPKNKLKRYILDKLNFGLYNSIKDLKAQRIIDIGCGEGFELKYINKKGFLKGKEFIGTDLSRDSINIAKKIFPHLDFRIGNIYNLDFKDKYFDLVLCIEIFEHLDKPESALQEIKRICNKYLLISVPNQPLFRLTNLMLLKYIKNLGDFPDHKNSWRKNQFAKLLKNYFEIIKIKTVFFWNIYLCKININKTKKMI